MKYGFNWPSELQAQKAIITYFDRQLEKGYTLIRNMTLGKSGITVPIILLGPTGIHVIHVTYLKGRYEARGEDWNVASGDGYKPAADNLIQQTLRMARAVRAFIERQGVQVPVEIEPVLIGGDPGLHIESVKPAIRVLMIDGVKSFVANLVTAQPVLRPESVYEFTERLVNPHPPRKATAPAAAAAPAEPAATPSWTRSLHGRRRSSRPPKRSSPSTRRILTLPWWMMILTLDASSSCDQPGCSRPRGNRAGSQAAPQAHSWAWRSGSWSSLACWPWRFCAS